jgi:hypothetical protein
MLIWFAVVQFTGVNSIDAEFWVVVVLVCTGVETTIEGAKHCLKVMFNVSLSLPQVFLIETKTVLTPGFNVTMALICPFNIAKGLACPLTLNVNSEAIVFRGT